MGYELSDKKLKRAGLDYHEYAPVKTHDNFESAMRQLPPRRFAATADGDTRYDRVAYQKDDVFLFGCESQGLPATVRAAIATHIYIPMRPNNRSLNLSNAVAVITMEAWRQNRFTVN